VLISTYLITEMCISIIAVTTQNP